MASRIRTSNSKPAIEDIPTASCERCRRRKIGCDRQQPCTKCHRARAECIRQGIGEKRRPVPKSHVQALENQVASLELFIRKVAAADHSQREELLAEFKPAAADDQFGMQDLESKNNAQINEELVLARVKAGQLRKLRTGSSTQFYGGTSLFQIHISEDASVPLGNSQCAMEFDSIEMQQQQNLDLDSMYLNDTTYYFAPHDDISQELMATFFRKQYPYNFCLYREYFLRDYDTGTGRYYSDLLLYAICSMGALASDNPALQPLSETFSNQSQALLYSSLENPDLTTLQALILLGQREIGHGKTSKGWLFSGMAFRLAHEMGLHLDPHNWQGAAESPVDIEVSRRVYWAAFVADKQLSLYFGRPPALYPHESDVRDTRRIPYPADWEGLLDTYIEKGTSATAYEDGLALAGSFIYQAELSKILHRMITDLFENRRNNADSSVIANSARNIHTSLTNWLAELPGRLHWNQWKVGEVPPAVLHLHMLFHTAMIILHRPPRNLFRKPGIATSEDVEICYESLQAILRLMRTYSRYYSYRNLPLDFVHTLSTAAGTILMKRFFEDASWEDNDISRSMTVVLQAMVSIKDTWPCIREIQESITQAMQSRKDSVPRTEPLVDLGFTPSLVTTSRPQDHEILSADLGPLITEDFLRDFDWNDMQLP